jgi:vacuolar-type H+-ATPase subunit H
MFDKLKKLADQAKEKATPMVGQAAQKAAELAAEAKEKAGPLAEQAKERATELAAKAAPAVSQGVDKAAGSLDKATGGRFTGPLDKVQDVVHGTASKVADKAAGDPPTPPGADSTGGPASEPGTGDTP